MIDLSLTSIISVIIIAVVFIWRIKVATKNGFAKEVSNLVSYIVAFCVFKILAEGMNAFLEYRFGKIAYSIAMLALVFLVYRLVKLLLATLRLFSHLPVMNLLDKIMGMAAGFIEAFLLIVLLLDLIGRWIS